MKFLIEDSNKIDLHIHTEISDGKLVPEDILIDACEKGLEYISFTDHNVDFARFEFLHGYAEEEYNITIIPGCELDVFFKDKRIHLLAYNYNSLFNKVFLPIIQKNYKKNPLSLKKACKIIHLCGGVAIIAHPFKYEYDNKTMLNEIIETEKIDGLECIHAYHTQEEIDYLLELCNKNNLIVTAGSDFHKKGRVVREGYKQNNIDELPILNSTIEEQLIRARKKYPTNKR